MRASTRLFACALALAADPTAALAQSSPFAGNWGGTESVTDDASCTFSATGSHVVHPPASHTCHYVLPWTGVVDSTGGFTTHTGAGADICGEGPASSWVASENMLRSWGQVPASGFLPQPAYDAPNDFGGRDTCAAWGLQFSLSPPSVSGVLTCTVTTVLTTSDATGSTTTRCTDVFRHAHSAAPSPGASRPPLFPLSVKSFLTPFGVTATAQVQAPRPASATTNLYVFAHAPLSLVASSAAAGSDPCVLAQLDANGRLVKVDPTTMRSYATNVGPAQSHSVTLFDRLNTANVAGASFFVGYGTTPGAMLASGVYEGAVSVPGLTSCSAAAFTAAAPETPAPLSGMWWNPAESGWGIAFAQRGGNVFGAWYTYDDAGKSKWYVASNCAMPAGTTGTCSGPLYEVSGTSFFSASFEPSRTRVAPAGSLQVAFQDANHATMSYTVGSRTRTVPIEREVFAAGTTAPAVDYTDLWWNPAESGWGMIATHQYGTIFLSWFVHGSVGEPVWYVTPNCVVAGSGCWGKLYRTTGPAFGRPFDPALVQAGEMGKVFLTFVDANNAIVIYDVAGVHHVKSITRQLF